MFVFALIGCVTPTVATAVGPLGSSAVPLPDGVVAPAALDTHTRKVEVCGWPEGDQPPAELGITWHSFTAGEDRHITDYAVELLRGSPELQVTVRPHQGGPAGASLEAGAPWMGVALISLHCKREGRSGARAVSFEGADMVRIVADGSLL